MAEINAPVARKKKQRVPVLKKKLLRIDLTPMVDLGFLLITFFIFTTTIAEPRAMKLTMPRESKDSINVPEEKGLVVILGKSNLIYSYEAADPVQTFAISSFGNIRNFRQLLADKKAKAAREVPDDPALIISIKCTEEATYQNFVDMLDEMQINRAGIPIVDKLNDMEQQMIAKTL